MSTMEAEEQFHAQLSEGLSCKISAKELAILRLFEVEL
jgi:hypothetical protein